MAVVVVPVLPPTSIVPSEVIVNSSLAAHSSLEVVEEEIVVLQSPAQAELLYKNKQKTISSNFFIIFDKHSAKDPEWGKRLITPILGCTLPDIGIIKTNMSNEKTTIGVSKVISLEAASKEMGLKEPLFSKGLYHWVMFVLSLYTRVREKLNIDYESFVILQVVVSHSLYEINKSGNKTFAELEEQMSRITQKKNIKTSKLTFASIAEVLQLPRETVRRKVISLSKKDILTFNTYGGIKLGPSYKTIYKDFVSQTTLDLSSLMKKWEKSGALKTLLELDK